VNKPPEAAKVVTPTQQRQKLRRDNLPSYVDVIGTLLGSEQVVEALLA
jgi:hypothetical protein